MRTYRIIEGDAPTALRTLPDESVNCCVTSPPYWGLRDYGVPGQIGLERTPEEYVACMVEVFREVRRVLRDDGTLWLNLGDSYCATTKWQIPKELKPKDLVGIPWRVAFALQQPREDVSIKAREDRAWMAALVDGEGCLSILQCKSPHGSGDSFPPILQVRMCDPECIERARLITGFVESAMPQYPPSRPSDRAAYQWRLHGGKAARIIAEIYPYLCIKRKQAIIAWNHQRVRDSYETKRGVTIPPDALERQRQCRDLIRTLNSHRPVDIPSWMEEPRIKVEPGWYLRSDVIWAKPNPMPESVTDRPTKAHEYLFLLSKSERYHYDAAAIAEPSTYAGKTVSLGLKSLSRGQAAGANVDPSGNGKADSVTVTETRNRRSVWSICATAYPEAHFATFPPDLVKPCILAGCPHGGVVLDPFAGSGTTLAVATELGCEAIGIELNPAYCRLIEKRMRQETLDLEATA